MNICLQDLETSTTKSAEILPSVPTSDEATEKDETQKTSETSPDLKIKTIPSTTPTIPPKKPTSSPDETLPTKSSNKPPVVPSKEKKPVIKIAKPDQEVHKPTDKIENLTSSQTESESSSAQEHVSEEVSEETVAISAAPPVPPKKTPDKTSQLSVQPEAVQTSAMLSAEVDDPSRRAADTTDMCASEKEVVTKNEVNLEPVSLDDATPRSVSHSTELGNFPEESKKAEEQPADSEQHLDDGAAGSWSKDTVAAVMTNSQSSLDVSDDDDEEDIQVFDQTKATQADVNSQVVGEASLCQPSVPIIPPKPYVKAKSASHADLLLKSSIEDVSADTGSTDDPSDDVAKLKLEVSMQVEKTNELLFRLSKIPNMGIEENGPVNQLAEVMEKLKRADVVLTEGKELSPPHNESKRKSW